MRKCLRLIWVKILLTILTTSTKQDELKTMIQELENHDSMLNSSDVYVEAYHEGKKILQLNITLLKPFNSSYNVFITNLDEPGICPSMTSCDKHFENITSFLLPSSGSHLMPEYEPCIFHLTCSYNIKIKNFKDPRVLSVNYTIGKCVGDFCLCEKFIPKPRNQTALMFSNNELSFKYQVPSFNNDSDLSLISLDVDIREMTRCDRLSATMTLISHTSHLLNLHNELKFEDEFKKSNLLRNPTNVECICIKMYVVDDIKCEGPPLEIVIDVSKKTQLPYSDERTNISSDVNVEFSIIITVIILSIVSFNVIFVMLKSKRQERVLRESVSNGHNLHPNVFPLIPMVNNPTYLTEDWYEIPRNSIEFGKEIGRGAFGRVYVAKLSEIPGKYKNQKVAVKKLKKNPSLDEEEEFVSEIETMRRVGKHTNIVQLLGYCKREHPIMMIMEYVPCGDLSNYLRHVRAKLQTKRSTTVDTPCQQNNSSSHSSQSNSRQNKSLLGKYLDLSLSSSSSDNPYLKSSEINGAENGTSKTLTVRTLYTGLSSSISVSKNMKDEHETQKSIEYEINHEELHNFAIQIANGMKHIEQLDITHRDLAARNILIDDSKTLKISDFGLSRDGIYVNTRSRKLPLRWLSIEAIRDNLYSSKSDVWAFGIVLWEIGTLGGFPYPCVQNNEIMRFLDAGNRLEKPEICSQFLYELMMECWNENPDDRPSFSEIYERLNPSKNVVYIDFTVLNPSYVFPPTQEPSDKI